MTDESRLYKSRDRGFNRQQGLSIMRDGELS